MALLCLSSGIGRYRVNVKFCAIIRNKRTQSRIIRAYSLIKAATNWKTLTGIPILLLSH